jgi:hypothetical protein
MTSPSIMRRIGTPQELRSLLRSEPLDGAAVDTLLRGMGIAAVSVLLEELVESQARLTRRYLMERLSRFGGRMDWVGLGSGKEHSLDHCDRQRGFQWNRMGDQTIVLPPLRKPTKSSACVAGG